MLRSFDIAPYQGPLPITFEMNATDVAAILGDPESFQAEEDGRRSEYRNGSQIRIGYHAAGQVRDVSISPGKGLSLRFQGVDLLNDSHRFQVLVAADPTPEECSGFLIFRKIGLAMTGFHDGDESQRSINVFSQGCYEGLRYISPYDPQLLLSLESDPN